MIPHLFKVLKLWIHSFLTLAIQFLDRLTSPPLSPLTSPPTPTVPFTKETRLDHLHCGGRRRLSTPPVPTLSAWLWPSVFTPVLSCLPPGGLCLHLCLGASLRWKFRSSFDSPSRSRMHKNSDALTGTLGFLPCVLLHQAWTSNILAWCSSDAVSPLLIPGCRTTAGESP